MTLGWIGDHGSIHYLEKMKPIFEKIGKRYPNAELKIVCDTFFDCEYLPVIKKQWSSEEEVKDLQGFDIGVMPLMDDPWSWGKCGLKIIQYQGVGVPVVCTPVGINKDLVEDGMNGLWAATPGGMGREALFLDRGPGFAGKDGPGREKEGDGAFHHPGLCAPSLLRFWKVW